MGLRTPNAPRVAALAVVVAAAVAVGAPSPARAQSETRVAVIGRAGADPPVSPGAVADAVREVAEAEGRVVIAGPRVLANRRLDRGAVDAARLDDFARARALVDEGWDAYLRVQIDFAETRLVRARRVAVAVLDLDGGAELVAEASLRLGVARLQQGRTDEAARDFRLARALDPGREVGTSEFAPAIVSAFDEAVAAAPPSATLTVDSSAIATRISVNGRSVGGGVAAIDVPAGLVAVAARAPGRRPLNQLLLVSDAGASLELRFERDPLVSALDGGTGLAIGAAEITAAVEASALIAYAELDELVVVAPVWIRGAPALLGQRCEGAPARCTAVVERGFDGPDAFAAAAGALWRELAAQELGAGAAARGPTLLSDRRLRRGERRPDERGEPGERRWYHNPWLWAGAGAVAVTLGVGLGLALDGDSRVDSSVVVPPCEFTACE